jgi:hypothetical protein
MIGLGIGMVGSAPAQTGSSVPAPASVPPVSTAPQSVAPERKTPAGSRRNQQHINRNRVIIQDTTPVPKRPHRNGQANPRPAQRPQVNFGDAVKRQHHQRHDRQWWANHYRTIIFVTGCGYYYWDAGYWFPAWGYNPRYETYDYEGPIYTYGELLPDQVIYNVQRALKDLGYYTGPLTGSLGHATRAALTAFQEDNGLDATGAIDAPTVEALGLY